MARRRILFIINPIAGIRSKTNIQALCDEHLDHTLFKPNYLYTDYAGHGQQLTLENRAQYDTIIAVGGDGTINEIAQALINTNCSLAIIPLGSGNGLARHLKIPMETREAIAHLNDSSLSTIDTCTFNDRPFLCTAGIGFEAAVSSAFDKAPSRGLLTYLRVIIRLIKNHQPLTLDLPSEISSESGTFSLTFANAEQFGNNALIAPMASLTDGIIDVCHVKPFPLIALASVALKIVRGTIATSKYYSSIGKSTFNIVVPRNTHCHVDGDPFTLDSNSITVKVLPMSLKILS